MPTSLNRPIIARDVKNTDVQSSSLDAAFQGEYSGSNLIFAGLARPGTATSDPKWQIKKLVYSGSNLIQVLWPINFAGVPSSDYEFIWDDRASYNYE